MLSGLAEYIFGSVSSASDPSSSAGDNGVGQGTRPSPSMQITYADDDWVLVDVTNSPKKSKEPSIRESLQGNDPCHKLEESWIVTPPPCFNAGGKSPQELATSPMENLLIEHPSMSVYGPRTVVAKPRRTCRTTKPSSTPEPVIKKPRMRNLRVRGCVATQPPRRAAAVAARLGLNSSPDLAAIQEAEVARRQKKGSVSRAKVERHNKAYHQKSQSGKHHYRQNVAGRHSGPIYKQC